MMTDRDIVLRCVAQGLAADRTPVEQILSRDVRWCREDHTVDEAVEMMQAARIRRLPVIDKDRNLVGIVSLGDIAVKGSEELASRGARGHLRSRRAGPLRLVGRQRRRRRRLGFRRAEPHAGLVAPSRRVSPGQPILTSARPAWRKAPFDC